MAQDQKDRYIQYLAEQNQDLRLTGDAMKLVLEDFMAQMKELKDQMSVLESNQVGLQKELSEKNKLCKSLERKLKSTQEKLNYATEQLFGDRRQKVKSKTSETKSKKADSDRQKEKDDYDGTDDTLRTDSVDHDPSQEVKESSKKERDLSNRPDGYKTMGVAGVAIEHPFDLTKVPGRIIERRKVRVFSFRTFLTEECFEMVHHTEALNYLNRFWKGIFAYLDDSELPIDNNLAERTIRKLTTQHNNSLHYGSDAGAEIVAAFHSMIGPESLKTALFGILSEHFSNISSMGAWIMLTWFLTKSLWLLINVKFKTN